MSLRMLIVEDDRMLGEGLCHLLQQEGYEVDWSVDGETAERHLARRHYDILLLDLGLPGRSGLEVLQNLRRRDAELPVLIITARDDTADRVRGLDAGADDYLVKPFDIDELCARVRALLRRAHGGAGVLRVGDLSLDPAHYQVHLAGRGVELSRREFDILHVLMKHAGRVVPKERLERAIYGYGEEVESNAVEVHIHHLRKKIGKDRILTLRGRGYMLERRRHPR